MTAHNGSFFCDLCKKEYKLREDALACESHHKGGPIRVTEVAYRKPEQGDSEYPSEFRVVMADGTHLTFHRMPEKE